MICRRNNDIDEDEDDELNSAWISNIAKRNKRKGTVIDKFRRMSIAYVSRLIPYNMLRYQMV